MSHCFRLTGGICQGNGESCIACQRHDTPPDRMSRTELLRLMWQQRLDFDRETVGWLLDGAEAALAFFDELAEAKAARDALADEVAQLREQVATLETLSDDQYAFGAADERLSCATLAESLDRWPTGAAIAAAIRARGETYGAVALSQSAASAAQERPQGGDAGQAPPAPHFVTGLSVAHEPKPWRYIHGCQCPRCLEAKPGWDANGAPEVDSLKAGG